MGIHISLSPPRETFRRSKWSLVQGRVEPGVEVGGRGPASLLGRGGGTIVRGARPLAAHGSLGSSSGCLGVRPRPAFLRSEMGRMKSPGAGVSLGLRFLGLFWR